MALTQEMMDFINSPDTVDFIARRSDYFLDYVANNPKILIAQTIAGRYVLGYVNKNDFGELIKVLGTGLISSASLILGTLDRFSLEVSGIIQVHNQPYLDLKGRGVLIGFVDTGIDYTQDVFIYEDGTSKIQYIYDQTVTGNTPEGFVLGTEYTNEQINQALKSENPYDVVPHRDISGHGTFIASVAGGRKIDDFGGAAPDAEIIAVKLRKARPYYLEKYCVPPEQEFAFESSAAMLGVDYILQKARALNKPVVICLGLGSNFGSHDGYTIFTEYLSGISNQKGVCLCTAAGNESQERHHTQGKIPVKGQTQSIELKVGNDAGNIAISIWGSVPDRFSVSIRSPTGELISRIPAKSGNISDIKLVLERTRVTVEYHFPVEGSSGQLIFIRLLDPTPGIWTITLHGDIILEGTYHAWLPMTGFVSPGIEFIAPVPNYTITVPATMIGSICCGAYNAANNTLFTKTSWGPTRIMAQSPDLVAPGVNIGGYYPYGFGTMNGTSCACAITAGACALLLQWGIIEGNDVAMSTFQIRAYLIRGCTRSDAMSYPNYQWGYGTLNLIQTFSLMRDL